MEFVQRFICFISICFVITDIDGAKLQIFPSPNIQAGTTTVTIRCQASTSIGISKLFSIDIKVRKNTITAALMGHIAATEQPELGSGYRPPKYTIRGSLPSSSQISGSYLEVIIQTPNCNDQAEYQCITGASSNEGNISPVPQVNTNVTVQASPGNLFMYVQPDRQIYDVGDSVSLQCSGEVGNPAKSWQWQWRRMNSLFWEGYPNDADITEGTVRPPSDSQCSYSQETTLLYLVKMRDYGLQIRCIVDGTDQYSVNKTIYNDYEADGSISFGRMNIGSMPLIFVTMYILIFFE